MDSGARGLRFRELSVLVCAALGLSACGGGGNGNVKPAGPYAPPSPGYTPPSPGYSPPSPGYTPPTGPGNSGNPTTPTTPTPPPTDQPPLDAQLSLTNAVAAHSAGFNGAGVTIGVVDSGIMRNHPALAGRVTSEQVYIDPSTNNTSVDDVIGHGTWVSEIAAGKTYGDFPGGLAPGASLVSARIISDKAPSDNGSTPPSTVTAADAQPFQYVNANLIKAGVNVMNNSWGGITWDASDAATTKGFHDAYNTYINSWGGLVVFAAGNASLANPSTIAALPSLAPDLEKGWLAVVAVDSNHPTQLASYSNKCGIAMNYCLAAPGDVVVSGKDDTGSKPTLWIVKGTSFAAPAVSGAAALVWQAFPYFTNDQVRQTMLGTADDLGAPGVDPVFGYGMLDVGKAVKGPARFDWDDFDVTLNVDSTWSNAISGEGGLVKRGTGTLTLTNTLTYQGATQVIDGTLSAAAIPGDLYISNTTALMRDVRSIAGNVNNAGNLMVAGGDVAVGGDYYQGAPGGLNIPTQGRLAVELGSALRVSGKATIQSGDLYVIGAGKNYVVSARTEVLSAKGGLTGQFRTLDVAPGVLLWATLKYDPNTAWLDVSQVQATAVASMNYTAASFSAAQRVDSAFNQINTQVTQGVTGSSAVTTDFINGAANLQQTANTAALQRSLESLSGQLHAASAAMTFEAIDAGTRALSDRFDTLVDTRGTNGGWAQTLGYHGSMSRSGYGDIGYDLSGWMVGQDRRFGANGVFGFAVSQSQGLGRLAEYADQGQSRAVEGMLYGGFVKDALYGMARLGVGSYREDMRRHLVLGSDVASVASDTNGRYAVAYGESGFRASLGDVQFTPYANLQYARIARDGFNEFGGDGFGLKSGSQTVDRWQAGVGLRAGHTWNMGSGSSLSLQGRLQWQQALATHGDVFDASFTGVDQWAPVNGVGLSRYQRQAGVTLDWAMSARSNLQFGMDQYFGQHDQGLMGTLNYRLNF